MSYDGIIKKIGGLINEQEPLRKKTTKEAEEVFEFFKKLLSQSQESGKVVCVKTVSNRVVIEAANSRYASSIKVSYITGKGLYLSTSSYGVVDNFKKYITEFALNNGDKWDMLIAFLEETEKEPERALIEFKPF